MSVRSRVQPLNVDPGVQVETGETCTHIALAKEKLPLEVKLADLC